MKCHRHYVTHIQISQVFIVENGYLIADEGAFVLEAPVLPLLRL